MRSYGGLPAHLSPHTWSDSAQLGLLALIGFGLVGLGGFLARNGARHTVIGGIATVVAGLAVLTTLVVYHGLLQ